MDPALHYLRFGRQANRNPGPDFVGDEYLAVNPDVRYAKVLPLLHYERYGKGEGRNINFLECREPAFPIEAAPMRADFAVAPARHRRTALFASFFADGRIPEADLVYLRGLREVVDNIVFVADSPVLPGELAKLDGLAAVAICERHGAYDFGSYKRAWFAAKERGLMNPDRIDELVVANNSCYAPVYPFAECFGEMSRRACDFWGLTSVQVLGEEHVQSFFYVFRRRVVDGGELDGFFRAVRKLPLRGHVVMCYEFRLTRLLADAGYTFSTLVPGTFARKHQFVPTRLPITLMRDYHMPLLKVKAVNGDCRQSIPKALAIVRRNNPALANAIAPRPFTTAHRRISLDEYRASLPGRAEAIAARAARGEAVRALFLVSSPSMFPARPLMDAMLADPAFAVKIAVVPDMRWRDKDPEDTMAACEEELRKSYPASMFPSVHADELGDWPELCEDADIVCYPSPYHLSCFRYNPHYALGRGFLPIHVNYGFYRSFYDRELMGMQNYAYFWKAFFECDETMEEYRRHSILKGANAEKVGYVKMDPLADFAAKASPRRRVLLALHHSVEGGVNRELSLSNFLRHADYFLELPARHAEIDFVFRPHPFLFTITSRKAIWGEEKTRRWVERMKAHSNVTWSDGGDYLKEFAACDAIVQDCGSYLVEWLYTGKPCCYMLKSPGDIQAKFAPLGQACLEQCYLAYDAAAIDRFLADVVVRGDDPKAASRAAFRPRIAVNHPHAARAALASIKAGLGLSAENRE